MKFMNSFLMLSSVSIFFNGILCQKRNNYYNYPPSSSSSENYVGPSSYTTSFGNDYPAYGNYGLLNTKNPEFSSSYTVYGGEDGDKKEFGSTSYVNYPTKVFQDLASSLPTLSQLNLGSTSSFNSYTSHDTGSNDPTPISQHIEVTKPIVVPVHKKFPYPVSKKFPVAIPHPVLVPVPAPYAVNVEISHPIAVPVIREVRIPIEKEVLYPVEKKVFVTVDKPVQYTIEKHYPVYVPKPYPVKIPIVKTLIHKSPKNW